MIGFILKYWRLLLPALAVIGVLLTLWGAYNYAKAQGVDECRAEYETALQEAQEKAQRDIRQIRNENDKLRQTVLAGEDSGYGVGSVTRNVLDGLRDQRSR